MKTTISEANIIKKAGAVGASFLLAAGLTVPVTLTTSIAANTATVAYAEESAQEQAEAALAKLQSLESQMGEAENVYNQAVMDKEAAEKKVQEAQTRIDQCNEEMKANQAKLGSRAKSMYRSGSSSMLDLVLGSTTFTEFATNWGILETLNQKDADLIAESKSLRQEITEQKATLEEQQKIAEQKEAEAAKTYQESQSLVSSQKEIYDNLSAEAQAELEAARNAQTYAEQTNTNTNTNNGGSNDGGGSYSGDSSSQSVDDGTVLGRAYAEVGKPYVWGGVGPSGYDCSGFVSYCLTGSHTRIGTTTTFMGYPRVSDPQVGDLVVNSGHVAIYLGGGQIIHAANPSAGVCVTSISWMGGDYIFVRY
ncbi:MAG: NlpC/P60 family protein [Phoenicibacter congonensis]|uniref:NlpC/P60 family protein n=1 Tax=Phoenicibacter congonensis TaxID=1944646 RepID=A0AA43RIF9_9ACTN|nr:NlpC/P60 family protein [Phoenicibacter congonensis]